MNLLVLKLSLLTTMVLIVPSVFSFSFECSLPSGCFIKPLKYVINDNTYEKHQFNGNAQEIICMPTKGFQFRFEENKFMANKNKKCITGDKTLSIIKFVWSKKNDELIILDKSFNVSNIMPYTSYFKSKTALQFVNLRGFDINLSYSIIKNNKNLKTLLCIACTMNFYTNGKLIKSCQDILESNSTVMSFFQLNASSGIATYNSEYPTNVCPLAFKNANIPQLFLMGIVDSFYKKNILKFTSDVFNDLNSKIKYLCFKKIENINLDLNILNPSVFSKLSYIYIYGSLKSIDKNIFEKLPSLYFFNFHSAYFRKLIHQNGIDWINEINKKQKPVDITNTTEIEKNKNIIKFITIGNIEYIEEPLFNVFPDEDFCAYKDFPFNRLVILIKFIEERSNFDRDRLNLDKTNGYTCTYMWLTQYFELYYEHFKGKNSLNVTANNLKKVIDSKSFKERSTCNFKHRLDLCNKTNYKIENIWSTIDYYYLNKKLQSAFKIASYLISLFGIVTNLLTVIIILIKSNSELFKGFKQYTYLCINSLFCLMILVINILSWTTECFYPFEAFCPEIRKVVFFQFFKIIFKECLTTTFRFMLNFSYVAFALNRIALIKKDENKFLKFISEVSIKWYIVVTLIFSAGLSAMKFFKYEVNYDDPLMNYPVSNEWDIFDVYEKKSHTFDDAYFIVNSISDIINYVIFVFICVFIDIYMVRELRQVMADKLQKIERLYAQQSKTKVESAKKESDEAINKAIKMVVINTAIGVLFKMPISFIPILNVIATFYYSSLEIRYFKPSFGRFYSSLFLNGFYGQISDFTDFLFIISISIQPLVYKNFDKKIQIAYDRLFHKASENNNLYAK